MKKMLLFAFIFLAACSGQIPQVTVTSKVTVTLPPTETPIPTPTSHPQFIALQEQIAALGERFTLLSDGTVQDGGEPVPGLQVDPKGVVTITVNGEPVEIDPSIVNFDDEKGLSIDGFQDTDGDGDYEPAAAAPSPEQIAATIAELNTAWNGVLTIDPETFEITSKIGEGAPVEGMVYNPETGKITLTFYSDGLGRDFTQQIDPSFIDFGISDGVPVKVDDIVGALRLDGNGQLERVHAKDDGGETSVPLRTPAELNQMWLEDHSDTPGADEETLEKAAELYDLAVAEGIITVGNGGWHYIKYEDLYAKIYSGNFWGSNSAYIWNEETQKFDNHELSTSRLAALDNYPDHSVAFVIWLGADGKLNFELVAGPTNINRMASQYGKQAMYELGAYGYGE